MLKILEISQHAFTFFFKKSNFYILVISHKKDGYQFWIYFITLPPIDAINMITIFFSIQFNLKMTRVRNCDRLSNKFYYPIKKVISKLYNIVGTIRQQTLLRLVAGSPPLGYKNYYLVVVNQQPTAAMSGVLQYLLYLLNGFKHSLLLRKDIF